MENQNFLNILELHRLPKFDENDTIKFSRGVNVIVGEPNTGKTRWLQMLDYLLGEPDSPESSFGEALAEKYDSVEADIQIGDTALTVERKWKEHGLKGKVLVSGNAIEADEFQRVLLGLLDIPILKFPQGNPYGPRTWPELSFRSLLRHVYRQQRFWSDIADQQPKGDQLACLFQFLGVAGKIYPLEFSNLVSKQKEIIRLQERREQFVAMLHEVSRELLQSQDLRVALTPDSLQEARDRLNTTLTDLRAKRRAIAEGQSSELGADSRRLSERRVRLQADRELALAGIGSARERRSEVDSLRAAVVAEESRLARADVAADVFARFPVTHCPYCDQSVERPVAEGTCHVCTQPLPTYDPDSYAARLQFELSQLQGEVRETAELLKSIDSEVVILEERVKAIEAELQELNEQLQPYSQAFIVNPDLSAVDVELGQVSERVSQLERVRRVFETRERLAAEIEDIQREVDKLESEVGEMEEINFLAHGDRLADGINSYLNAISKLKSDAWSKKEAQFRLRRDRFSLTVDGKEWSTELGGTLTIYFLLAYHYSLLTLGRQNGANFPGLVILDLIPEVEGISVADKENFILIPYIELEKKDYLTGYQVIATGSAYENLEGVNRIELTTVW